ncbi:MAG: VOC family protein [Chloroflexota bacterium]
MFNQVDHIAIAVRNTDKALKLYRDKLGLPVLFQQQHPDQPLLMTHLDMGNVQLQLLQPLVDDHPVAKWLDEHGEGLHHLCFFVDDANQTIATLPTTGLAPASAQAGGGPNGRQAAFIDKASSNGVLFEFTSEPSSE